jgi:CDP-diacylglycerol--glycerol-3-phosphate 3-phosphatidyltransferase
MRLLLACVLFVLIASEHYLSSLAFFIVAAGTDFLDGYYARRFNQITELGRILDPFADKVIICGTFIFLATTPGMILSPWGLKAWMVVVIVGRELLVTALRSFLEERGSDFSANMSGKLKMVLQCMAAAASMIYLHYPPITGAAAGPFASLPDAPQWLCIATMVLIWAAVALTVYSGGVYVVIAWKLLATDRPNEK